MDVEVVIVMEVEVEVVEDRDERRRCWFDAPFSASWR